VRFGLVVEWFEGECLGGRWAGRWRGGRRWCRREAGNGEGDDIICWSGVSGGRLSGGGREGRGKGKEVGFEQGEGRGVGKVAVAC